MTNIKNKFLTVFLIISVIVTAISLILFSQEITLGIIDSVNRCLTVIIPSLFCFLVLSSFLIYTNLYIIISRPFDIISRYVFKIKTEHFSIFLLSLFAGYPAGAKLLSELKDKNMIDNKDSEKMLCYCYTAGPSFIIGLVGIQLFNNIKIGLLIYLSLVLTNIILAFIMGLKEAVPEKSPDKKYIIVKMSSEIVVESVKSGAKSLFIICAMIVFFSSICVFLNETNAIAFISETIEKITQSPKANTDVLINSFFEISFLGKMELNPYKYIPVITSLFSFGGICIILQVISIVNGNFKVRKFIAVRFLSMIISYFLSLAIMNTFSDTVFVNNLSESHRVLSNISPIPSVFLLIMTILLLSKKNVVKN